MLNTAEGFNDLFEADDDPWKFRSRWYEERKRALTMACLPARRYRRAFEPGCANGELSAELASRCDELESWDGSERAIAIARTRNSSRPHVGFRQAWMPDDWPDEESFDLVVLSEIGYYFDGVALSRVIAKTLAVLRAQGTVLACHWRRPIEGCRFDGDEVHRRMHAELAMPRLLEYADADLRIDVWCASDRSVADKDGVPI